MRAVDREQLKRELSDALSALQKDQTVLGLDELAASLTTLGPTYAFHGRLMQSALQATPWQYSGSSGTWCKRWRSSRTASRRSKTPPAMFQKPYRSPLCKYARRQRVILHLPVFRNQVIAGRVSPPAARCATIRAMAPPRWPDEQGRPKR